MVTVGRLPAGGGLMLLLWPLAAAAAGAAGGCAELGFPSPLCATCARLGERVGAADALVAECTGCCSEGSKKYSRAVLQVIAEFLETSADKFANFEVRYEQGAPPVMLLENERGEVEEEISLSHWKTENLQEFLHEKLISLV
ncbi:hypothetical protein T492DRAFT_878809 [Pavlovales sp. CCMP2436]|nr:hypothetical protein T492DRAFT_878809 [Pavlovales sp. CCMP2436]